MELKIKLLKKKLELKLEIVQTTDSWRILALLAGKEDASFLKKNATKIDKTKIKREIKIIIGMWRKKKIRPVIFFPTL